MCLNFSVEGKGLVDGLNLFFGESIKISVLLLDDGEGVDLSWGYLYNSVSAFAFLEALRSLIVASLEALSVASEFGGDLFDGREEVSLHGHASLLMSNGSGLNILNESQLDLMVCLSHGFNISLESVGDGLLISLRHSTPLGVAMSLVKNAFLHLTSGCLLHEEAVNALGSNLSVAGTGWGKVVEHLDVQFSEWLHVLSKVNKFSNSVSGVGFAKVINNINLISFTVKTSFVSICLSCSLDLIKLSFVPFNSWDDNLTGIDGSDEGENLKFHIFDLIYYKIKLEK